MAAAASRGRVSRFRFLFSSAERAEESLVVPLVVSAVSVQADTLEKEELR